MAKKKQEEVKKEIKQENPRKKVIIKGRTEYEVK